ncbi:MAG: shikimate kinase [Parcubacteria group bacterium]|nr:shikimate kinase [Parcubacteria group bacterium]
MAGAGKSTIGRLLAKKLRYRFVDIDALIEKSAGIALQDILDELGDEKFIQLEEEVVLALKNPERFVISTGGSVVYSKKAMGFLRSISNVIFLNAPYDLIQRRMQNVSSRGIVGLKNKDLHSLWKERKPLYEKYADYTVTMERNAGPQDTVNRIIKKVQKISG